MTEYCIVFGNVLHSVKGSMLNYLIKTACRLAFPVQIPIYTKNSRITCKLICPLCAQFNKLV